jgi:heme-degrading monooxygenase HmoA
MYIAMNRFQVRKCEEAAFETVWRNREVHIDSLPGFLAFHLLKGPEREDHTLYASHTVWESAGHFEAWTKSEAFRLAHHGAGQGKPLFTGHPVFEGFEAVQTLAPRAETAGQAGALAPGPAAPRRGN